MSSQKIPCVRKVKTGKQPNHKSQVFADRCQFCKSAKRKEGKGKQKDLPSQIESLAEVKDPSTMSEDEIREELLDYDDNLGARFRIILEEGKFRGRRNVEKEDEVRGLLMYHSDADNTYNLHGIAHDGMESEEYDDGFAELDLFNSTRPLSTRASELGLDGMHRALEEVISGSSDDIDYMMFTSNEEEDRIRELQQTLEGESFEKSRAGLGYKYPTVFSRRTANAELMSYSIGQEDGNYGVEGDLEFRNPRVTGDDVTALSLSSDYGISDPNVRSEISAALAAEKPGSSIGFHLRPGKAAINKLLNDSDGKLADNTVSSTGVLRIGTSRIAIEEPATFPRSHRAGKQEYAGYSFNDNITPLVEDIEIKKIDQQILF